MHALPCSTECVCLFVCSILICLAWVAPAAIPLSDQVALLSSLDINEQQNYSYCLTPLASHWVWLFFFHHLNLWSQALYEPCPPEPKWEHCLTLRPIVHALYRYIQYLIVNGIEMAHLWCLFYRSSLLQQWVSQQPDMAFWCGPALMGWNMHLNR